jgi:hypothetical protein
MNIESDTIATIIPRLNNDLFLPAMQRDYVWKVDQIYTLFDSLMQGYPISTFLFWKAPAANANDIERYSFLRTVGVRNNPTTQAELDLHGRRVSFVLDGQQRLTSINVGVNGTYREPNAPRRPPVSKQLFINVLHDPNAIDRNSGHRYHFEFREVSDSGYIQATVANQRQYQYWVSVREIFQLRRNHQDQLNEILNRIQTDYDRQSASPADAITVAKIKQNTERLYEILFEEKVLAHHTEETGDAAKMLEIFIRANNGGTALKKSDLMLSTLTLHWTLPGSARTAIADLLKDLNKLILKRNVDGEDEEGNKFKIDFVMKACLVLLDKPVAYNIQSFSSRICSEICHAWDRITEALKDTVKLVKSFGITSSTLLSVNALMPIAYYLYTNPNNGLAGETDEIRKVAIKENIRIWLHGALINGIFGGTSDQTISKLRECIINTGDEFSIEALDRETSHLGETPVRDIRTINEIMALNYQNNEKCFLALAMLYPNAGWISESYSIDHLFPQRLFGRNGELTAYADDCHKIANLCLVSKRNNSAKGAVPMAQWTLQQTGEYIHRHLIPQRPELWSTNYYSEFTSDRAALLRQKFREIFKIDDA